MIAMGLLLTLISMAMLLTMVFRIRKSRDQSQEMQQALLTKMINFNYLAIILAVIGLALLTIGLIFR